MTAERITFDSLVEMLGAQNAPRDSDGLFFLRLFLDAYRRDLAHDGPRVSELSSLIGEIESDIRHVAPRLATLDNLCEPLPEPSIDCEVTNLRTAAHDLLSTLDAFLGKLNAVKDAVGKDAGGHGTAASKLSGGSAKRQFARNLATIFADFRGAPSGTEDGSFYEFVCACHEVAMGKQAKGFGHEVKDAAKHYRALSPRK